jgi:4-hydroxy-2-oxoheptanedioate aldolase
MNWMLTDPHDYWEHGMGDLWPLNPAGELLAIPMIESPIGVKNVDDILKVPGVAGVAIGTSDLNSRMNEGWVVPQNPTFGPKTEVAMQKVFAACVSAKKYCGIPTANEAMTKKYVDMGARFIYKLYR